jgi:hypothetical protein
MFFLRAATVNQIISLNFMLYSVSLVLNVLKTINNKNLVL